MIESEAGQSLSIY